MEHRFGSGVVGTDVPVVAVLGSLPPIDSRVCELVGGTDGQSHWGQEPVSRAGTLQVHCKQMDNVIAVFPLRTLQEHCKFSKLIFMQFSMGREFSVHFK